MNVVSKCRHDEICSCIPSQALAELRLEFEPILETKKFLEATIAKLTHEFQKQSELNVRTKARLAKLQVDISESVDDRQTEQARLIPVVKLVFEHNKLFFSRLEKKGSLFDLSRLFEIRTLEGMWELYKPVIDVPEIPNRKNDVEEEFVFLQDDPQDGVHDMREAGVLLEYLTQANMVLQGKFAQKKISLTHGTHCVHMIPCHCIDLSKFAEEIKAVDQTKRKTIPTLKARVVKLQKMNQRLSEEVLLASAHVELLITSYHQIKAEFTFLIKKLRHERSENEAVNRVLFYYLPEHIRKEYRKIDPILKEFQPYKFRQLQEGAHNPTY